MELKCKLYNHGLNSKRSQFGPEHLQKWAELGKELMEQNVPVMNLGDRTIWRKRAQSGTIKVCTEGGYVCYFLTTSTTFNHVLI